MVDVIPLTTADLVNKLESSIPFSLSRFGDGEWHAILGTGPDHNCDGHFINSHLGQDLRSILTNNESYYHCILGVAFEEHRSRIDDFIRDNDIKIPWYDGDQLLLSSIKGYLRSFIDQMRKKRILYVCNENLKSISKFMTIQDFVIVPRIDAMTVRFEVTQEMLEKIFDYEPQVIGFSAGFLTKVLIDDLFPLIGGNITMIDFGSLFDPYCGYKSRSYSRDHNLSSAIFANTGLPPCS